MNPLFARELRARWRDRRAWWLLLLLAIALALLAHWMFEEGVSRELRQVRVRTANGSYVWRTEQITPSARAARAGRDLFMALSLGNVTAWLLVAPILAATPIARERERGLLESLQLSHLSPRSQIAARASAYLAFTLLLQLAIAPVYAIIFWLGGVSPGELALAGAVISLTAVGGVALGTFISARSHRPTGALLSALGTIILWTLSLYPALIGLFSPFATYWVYPATVVFWSHPLPIIGAVTDTSGQFSSLVPAPPGWDNAQFVWAVCAGWAAVSLVLLAIATRLVRQPLPPASWEGRASAPVEAWRRSLAQRQSPQLAIAPTAIAPDAVVSGAVATGARAPKRRRIENTLVADVPVEKFIRFADPLLEREVRARFRLRRGGWALMLGRFALFAAGVWVWGYSIYSLGDGMMRRDVSPVLLYILWGLGALAVGALSSASFARERESGTWEALKMSLLLPLEIVRAKWLSPLWAFAIYAAPLWLLVPFGVAYGDKTGMDANTMLLSIAIVALSLGTISMLGLLISWRARQPNAALGWLLGIGLFLLVVVPILREVADVDAQVSEMIYGVYIKANPWENGHNKLEQRAINFQRLTSLWHPVSALNYVDDARDADADELPARAALWMQLAVFAIVVGGGAWSLRRDIARDHNVSAP